MKRIDPGTIEASPNVAGMPEDVLEWLYIDCYDRIYRFCVYRLFDKQKAEDLTSAVFLHAARNIRSVNNTTAQGYRNWLYAVAVNQTNTFIRKHLRKKKFFENLLASQCDQCCITDHSHLDWPHLHKAISTLSPKEQAVITLRFFEQMPHSQIAAILNEKEPGIRTALHRSLKKLKKIIEPALLGE